MKIILSRKGFDSEAGGFASPILPDGRLVSLPIPEQSTGIKYSNLSIDNGMTYYSLIASLTGKKIKSDKRLQLFDGDTCCHLDPDIAIEVVERTNEWRGSLGQIDQAAIHLKNQNVCKGDLFLFFGWFRKTIWNKERIVYDAKDKDGCHVLFGYLQIGEIIHPELSIPKPTWLAKHPHYLESRIENPTNTIFLAAEKLSFGPDLPGFGRFSFSKELVLSKKGETKSKWALPEIFKETAISYHKTDSWKNGYFQSVGRGQEFVMETTDKIEKWIYDIITKNVLTTK